MGAETDWPPFDFVIQGRAAGFTNDYARLLARKIGTVNISARLESLTKESEQRVLCSADFAGRLSPALREPLVELGRVQIRGRQTELGLLGC